MPAAEIFPALYRSNRGEARLGAGTRLFLALRWHFTPYFEMASKLPSQGRILDLGCGHGLLAYALARSGSERRILGIDHDEARVRLARQAFQQAFGDASGESRVKIEKGSLLAQPEGPFAGIAAIDVMHYFTPEEQQAIVKSAWERLERGGTLILREVDPSGGAASKWNRLYEKLATATGFTRSEGPKLHFRTPDGWLALLRETGFEAGSMPCSHFLFADVLYVARKP